MHNADSSLFREYTIYDKCKGVFVYKDKAKEGKLGLERCLIRPLFNDFLFFIRMQLVTLH